MPDDTERAAFEVRAPDGHLWKVFGDGRTEGFPVGCIVFNRIPLNTLEAVLTWPKISATLPSIKRLNELRKPT